jgi:serine/threonine-protein kinase RsbW
MSSAPAEFHRRIAGSYSEIHPLGEAVTDWALGRGVPSKVVPSVVLMLDELVTNVVMHGFRDSGDGQIDVTIRVDSSSIETVIRDSAREFDPFSIPEPDTTLPAEDRGIGGLGVHFVRKMSDAFGYRRDGDVNEVRFRKRLG